MKYLVQAAFAAAVICSWNTAYAADNGINYDPAHDQPWFDAQKASDISKMWALFVLFLALE